MRLIIKDFEDMSIFIEGINEIINNGSIVIFRGDSVRIIVNGFAIATFTRCEIDKKLFLMADEVYFDTRIEETEPYEATH